MESVLDLPKGSRSLDPISVLKVETVDGKTVWQANPIVMGILQGHHALLAEEKVEHSYPHCWRCHHPTIFRATASVARLLFPFCLSWS